MGPNKCLTHSCPPLIHACLLAHNMIATNKDMGHDTADEPVPCPPEMPIGSSPDSRTAPHLPEMVPPPISIPAPILISAQPTPLRTHHSSLRKQPAPHEFSHCRHTFKITLKSSSTLPQTPNTHSTRTHAPTLTTPSPHARILSLRRRTVL